MMTGGGRAMITGGGWSTMTLGGSTCVITGGVISGGVMSTRFGGGGVTGICGGGDKSTRFGGTTGISTCFGGLGVVSAGLGVTSERLSGGIVSGAGVGAQGHVGAVAARVAAVE